MTPIDLSQYYSGGYFLIRADNPGWDQLKSELLPDQFISLSHHFCPRLNVNWGWKTGDPKLALQFGIPTDKLEEFIAWCQSDYSSEMDMWSMFHSVTSARHFIRRFLPNTEGLYIIGAGLPHELEEKDWREPEPSEEKVYGIEKRIEKHLPMDPNGKVLGFEVVSFEYGDLACSWLCSHLHEKMYQLFGVHPNRYGLIDKYDEAKKIYEWIAEDDMKGTRAEPAPYDCWLLLSYPLNVEKMD